MSGNNSRNAFRTALATNISISTKIEACLDSFHKAGNFASSETADFSRSLNLENVSVAARSPEDIRLFFSHNLKLYFLFYALISPKLLSCLEALSILRSHRCPLPTAMSQIRILIENMSALAEAERKISNVDPKLADKDRYIELSHVLAKSAASTRFHIRENYMKPFEKMNDVGYNQHSKDSMDFSAPSIQNAIKKTERRFKIIGMINLYNYACEYVHPSSGGVVSMQRDILSNSNHKPNLRRMEAKFRTIGDLSADQQDDPNLALVYQAFQYFTSYSTHIETALAEIIGVAGKIFELHTSFSHKLMKSLGSNLDPYELCLCGSGKKVKFCSRTSL